MVTLCYAAQRGICITVVPADHALLEAQAGSWMRGAVLHLYQDGDRELHEVSLSRGFLNLERLLIPIWTIRQSYAPTGTYHNCTKLVAKCTVPFFIFVACLFVFSTQWRVHRGRWVKEKRKWRGDDSIMDELSFVVCFYCPHLAHSLLLLHSSTNL